MVFKNASPKKKVIIIDIVLLMLFFTIKAAMANDNNSINQTVNATSEVVVDYNVVQGLNDEEFKAAISLCSQREGSLYRIGGTIYCGVNEQYVELEKVFDKPATVNMIGSKMYDVGSLISPDYPALGWILFFTLIITAYFFIKEEVNANRRRDEIRAEHEENSRMHEESKRRDKRKMRPDGGYY
mgnify:CR=1 FL=1